MIWAWEKPSKVCDFQPTKQAFNRWSKHPIFLVFSSAVAIACCYRYEWPCLVITPSSLRHGWQEAFKKWASSTVDSWKVKVIDKGPELKEKALVQIISYTLAANCIEELKKRNFKVIIAVNTFFFLSSFACKWGADFSCFWP